MGEAINVTTEAAAEVPRIGSGGKLYSDAEKSFFPPRLADSEQKPEKTGCQKGWWSPRLDWREIVSDSAELAGIGAVSAGFWQIAPAAGLISAGLGLVLLGVAVGRGA
jgi:hypothetical protein